jgi:hypothetical protein
MADSALRGLAINQPRKIGQDATLFIEIDIDRSFFHPSIMHAILQ